MINPLAEELNGLIAEEQPSVLDMLSDLGKHLYYPKGILSQGAEAKEKGKKFNATIGIATEGGQGMHLPCIKKYFNDLAVDEIFTYAPSFGLPSLRERWKQKIVDDTPSLADAPISTPVVTQALTHGLAICADLFIDPGDIVVLPDKIWGNYTLILNVRKGAEFLKFPFFEGKRFNVGALEKTLQEAAQKRDKLLLLLNFPNNPTGYSISKSEAEELTAILTNIAAGGTKLVVFIDDAYYGLFYEEDTLKESIFGTLAHANENLLAVRLNGATKELYMWGFRVGFLTYGIKGGTASLYTALEKKTAGAVRGSISNCSKLSQSVVLKVLDDPDLQAERAEKFEVMKGRALKVKEVLKNEKYEEAWEVYNFNAGYFMCLKIKGVDAETVRLHLLDKYQTGVIATSKTDLRIAFSCLEEGNIEELFEILYKAVKETAKDE
jgi:aspartate/methionine/tyrosine aminotransferase